MARPTLNASNVGGALTTALTVNVTVGTGANRAAYAFTNNRDAGAGDVTGVTCGGSAMAQLGTTIDGGNSHFRVWRFIAPATGSVDFVASVSGTRQVLMIVVVLDGVDQATPEETAAIVQTAAAQTTGAITLTDDQALLSFIAEEDSNFPTPPHFTATGTATVTELEDDGFSAQFSAASLTEATGSVTASWTDANSYRDGMGLWGIPVNGITGGGGPTTHDAAASFSAVATLSPTARALRAAQASFAGVATTSASATAIRGVSASFSGVATLTPRARALRAARATFAGVGTFGASIAGGIVSAACSFAGVGTASFAASRIAHARASFAGVGTVTAAARRIAGVAASFSATATLSPTARALRAAAVVFSGVGTFDAVAVADEAAYQGKYASDHAGALAAVKSARGFAGDHAGALAAVRGAGR